MRTRPQFLQSFARKTFGETYMQVEKMSALVPWSALCLLFALIGCARTERLPPSPVVTTSQGKLRGYTDKQGVWVYEGIAFAKPPVVERPLACP
jgi:hypothetical protein